MDLNPTVNPDYLYSIKELAFVWNVSREWVRRKFKSEPGVVGLQENPTPGKRIYCPLRIPGRVAIRVQNRLTVVSTR
jgi:hypothetical protein